MSVKRYSNAVGVSHLSETFDSVTGKPRGDFVYSRDYDALRAALREALDGWHKVAEHWLHQYASEMCDEKLVEKSMLEVQDAGGTLSRIARDNMRIAELRKFLDDK